MLNNITTTTLHQLGGRHFMVMTGARIINYDCNTIWLSIGRNASAANRFAVTYNEGKDLYDVRFCKGKELLKVFTDVYCDNLQSIFTSYTGLYTHL